MILAKKWYVQSMNETKRYIFQICKKKRVGPLRRGLSRYHLQTPLSIFDHIPMNLSVIYYFRPMTTIIASNLQTYQSISIQLIPSGPLPNNWVVIPSDLCSYCHPNLNAQLFIISLESRVKMKQRINDAFKLSIQHNKTIFSIKNVPWKSEFNLIERSEIIA